MDLNSIAQKFNQQFTQARQLAVEKLGTPDPGKSTSTRFINSQLTECITDLPPEYVQLEMRLEKVKVLYEQFLRLGQSLATSDAYTVPVTETMKDAFSKINGLVQQKALGHANTGNNESANGTADAEHPRTLAHALARCSLQHAQNLGDEEPLGAALKNYAVAEERVGDAHLKMESQVISDFCRPWAATLTTNIQFAMKARKQVQTTRLALNAAKSTLKTAKADRIAHAQTEMQNAEMEFNLAVQDATNKMKLVVDSPEPIRNLAGLVDAQLAYFKAGFDALSALAPEVHELQVTQEALFRTQ